GGGGRRAVAGRRVGLGGSAQGQGPLLAAAALVPRRPQRGAPVELVRTPLTSTGQKYSLSLAAVVPLILILMTITGAVYPAIDLTAGERERGTLEILIAAPIPRLSLLLPKSVAGVAVAFLTALRDPTAIL